jgi:hypothetical protein
MNRGISEGFAPSTIRARKVVWVRFANSRHSQRARRGRRETTGILVNFANSQQSRDAIIPATTNAIGLVEKVIPAQRRFRILIDHDNDGLDMSVAPFFPRRAYPNFTRALIQGGLSALWSHHLSGPDIEASVAEVVQLRPLTREQELRPHAVQAGLIWLASNRA